VTAETVRVAPEWLRLRERADAAARSTDLVSALLRQAAGTGTWIVHDLACGTGAMTRWLAPRLPGPQRWVIHDRDEHLLSVAAGAVPQRSADGAPIDVEPRRSDITRLEANDVGDATLITASAVLDLLTAAELAAVVDLCVAAGCPVLLTLSVTGDVALTPADPLDARVACAFDAHQRRVTPGGRLLGPDAPATAAERFRRSGADVLVHSSPWRLGGGDAALTEEWFTGWAGAACEQEPELAAEIEGYVRDRLHQARAGQLAAVVSHVDLLVLP
jgi:SAM-dependent methyltransferase